MSSELIELIEGLRKEAGFAENNDFHKGAALFRKAADTLSAQQGRIEAMQAALTKAAPIVCQEICPYGGTKHERWGHDPICDNIRNLSSAILSPPADEKEKG